MEAELRQAALEYISSAKVADLDELTSSINARHGEIARVKAAEEEAARVKAAQEEGSCGCRNGRNSSHKCNDWCFANAGCDRSCDRSLSEAEAKNAERTAKAVAREATRKANAEAKLTELFGQIDRDGDGLIDRDEFHKAMTGKRKQQLRALLKATENKIETETVVWYNRDGDVRWGDQPTGETIPGEDWKAVLKRIDADHDGNVNIHEFITACDDYVRNEPITE